MCSHTATVVNPYWRVDLGSSHSITSVALTNRGDCCGDRLSNFEIRIGNTLDDSNRGVANPATSGSPYGVSKGLCGNHLLCSLPFSADSRSAACHDSVVLIQHRDGTPADVIGYCW